MVGNILFPGNPYPAGHSIKDCKFFATEDVDGSVRLHLRLVTEDYSMSAANETDDSSDWTSKTVWDNYGHSIISSVDWGRRGFIVSENLKNFLMLLPQVMQLYLPNPNLICLIAILTIINNGFNL